MRWASIAAISLATTLCAPTLLHAQNSSTGVHIDAAAKSTITPVNGPIAAYRRDDGFFKFPPGRRMGSSSTVAGDSKGHIWVVDRCAANDCAGSKLDPVMEFDAKGNFIKSFGAGQILFPHGMFIDKQDHIWIADNHNNGKIGDSVLEYDQTGKILRTLGKPGVAGNDQETFHEPNAVLIAPDGSIFVSDGHGGDTILTRNHGPEMGNSRVMKFDHSGKFLLQWGKHGSGPGEFQTPHCLTMDSAGRVFVGDRSNNRIQIFDQQGKFIAEWSQFGRPSGCYIDKNDVLYVSDSESKEGPGYAHHPGWKRGVRIGSAKTGKVTAFIPDEITDPAVNASGGEGVWADGKGVVYNAEVFQEAIVRYLPPK
jgi:DNA-binding beta-propeller fold protein YncE